MGDDKSDIVDRYLDSLERSNPSPQLQRAIDEMKAEQARQKAGYVETLTPPTPSPTIWHHIESWFRPIQFATQGEGHYPKPIGEVYVKQLWMLKRGRLRKVDYAPYALYSWDV